MDRAGVPYEFEQLWEGWLLVRERNACAGVDGVTVRAYERNARPWLLRLADVLRKGAYQPRPLVEFSIPKPTGGERLLAIPTVSDRIVQRAALDALEPFLEPSFLTCSYAFRRGRSVQQAVLAVSGLRTSGYDWVAHVDIRDCFDSIDWRFLLERLKPFAQPALRLLIRKWIEAPRVRAARQPEGRGIPQGGVISPALCNLVLTSFDTAITRAGIPLVRYADDCLLFARSEREARGVLLVARDALREVKLEPNIQKSEVTSFSEGFRYLGTLFVKTIVLPCIRVKTDSGKTVYVSGYEGNAGPRKPKVRAYRERGHITVAGGLDERSLERLAAKAMLDETRGTSTALGRALMEAYRRELKKTAAKQKQSRPAGVVALIP